MVIQFLKIAYFFKKNRLFLNLLIFLLPVLLVIWTSGVWICFFIFIIFSDTSTGKHHLYLSIFKENYIKLPNLYLVWIFISYFIISLISVLLLNSPLKALDNAIIFIIFMALSPILTKLPLDHKVLAYGCLFAVSMALFIAIWQFYFLGIIRSYGFYGSGTFGSGAIKFGDISILLGILSLVFLSESQYKTIGLFAGLIGFIVCLISGARGGVFALFLGVCVWYFAFRFNKLSWQYLLKFICLSFVIFFILDFFLDNSISIRIKQTTEEIALISHGQFDSSFGIRLQLWNAALIMFENNPVIGVGLNNFGNELVALNKAHLVSDMAANYKHAHNEYLCALATGGIIGFSITCLLFFVPLAIFKIDYQNNVWAKAGFWSVCLMSFFALTDCVFDRRMTVVTFALFISVCMAGNIAEKNYK